MKAPAALLLGLVFCLVGCDTPLKSPPPGPEDKMINVRQFDPFDEPHGRLLLVAPNVVHVERELGVDVKDPDAVNAPVRAFLDRVLTQ